MTMASHKKKAKSDTDNGMLLNVDLLMEVFVRLPVKSLVRFKSVCKHWKSLISSRELAKLHEQHATIHGPALRLFSFNYRPDDGTGEIMQTLKFELCEVDKMFNSVDWTDSLNKPAEKFNHKFGDAKIFPIGSCKGLICCIVGLGHTLLCLLNPATREYSYVKGPCLSKQSQPLYWGFGYDPLSDDYKILLWGFEICKTRKPFARIKRLRTTNWRRIACPSDQDLSQVTLRETDDRKLESLPVLVGQTLYWQVEDIVDAKKLIAFDLTRESFEILSLPVPKPLASDHKCGDFFICQLSQCLCACWLWNDSNKKHPDLYITVWILEGRGDTKVWKSLFIYRGLQRGNSDTRIFPKLFELKKHGKYLIPFEGFRRFYVVDPRGLRYPSKLVFFHPGVKGYSNYIFEYTETLASPTHYLAPKMTKNNPSSKI